jgi:predicted membrane protein
MTTHPPAGRADSINGQPRLVPGLFLPGALLMAMRAQLLAPFVLVNFCFPTFF